MYNTYNAASVQNQNSHEPVPPGVFLATPLDYLKPRNS